MQAPGAGSQVDDVLAAAMIDAILFDKDGTLVDLLATWLPTYRAATDQIAALAGDSGLSDRLMILGGWSPDTGRLAAGSPLSCSTNDDIIELWATDPVAGGVTDMRGVAKRAFYQGAVEHAAPIVPLRPLLSDLRARGLRLGIATMDNTDSARQTVARLGLDGLFDLVVGFDAGFGAKPDPGMVLAFCEATGVPPARVAMVGDARKDLDTGRNAGVGLKVAVLTGAAGREELAPHADVVLGSVGELLALVDRLNQTGG